MSFEESLRSISLNADASLAKYTGVPGLPGSAKPNTGNMFRFVKVTGHVQVGLATGESDQVVGVMLNKPQVVGMAATVAYAGVANVVVEALPIAAGDAVAPGAAGGAVKAAGAGAGVALSDASTVGEVIPVLIGA